MNELEKFNFEKRISNLENDYYHLLDYILNNKKITKDYHKLLWKEYEELKHKRDLRIESLMRKSIC